MATQNPIEQEGTYPLPEAQMDRFMLKVVVGYPNRDQELLILERMSKTRQRSRCTRSQPARDHRRPRTGRSDLCRPQGAGVYRRPGDWPPGSRRRTGCELDELIQYGASPRATIYLTLAAKANAFLHGRGHVLPQDVKEMALDVLRHRVILTYEAEAEEKTSG